MSWHPPIDWSGVPTATQLTEQLQENLEHLYRPPSCRVQSDSSQTLTHNTPTDLLMQTEDWDTDTMHSGVSGTVSINTAGRWFIWSHAEFAAAAGSRLLIIRHSNGSTLAGKSVPNASGYRPDVRNCSNVTPLAAAVSITARATQESGGNLNVLEDSCLGAHWLGGV